MPTHKVRLALIFGGRSAEHDVSLASAHSVLGAINPERYEVSLIAISRRGEWLTGGSALDLLSQGQDEARNTRDLVAFNEPAADSRVVRALAPGAAQPDRGAVDVVFPILHGPLGEDGAVQGLLELAGVPYVGAGVAASAVGMDKVLMKRLFEQAGLPVMPFIGVTRPQWHNDSSGVAHQIADTVGYPCFVKPANMGSSVGINRVDEPDALSGAMAEATQFDRRVIVERAAPAPREIECGVLGNERPEVSVVGEIKVASWAPFYNYDAKYQPGASDLIVPADLPDHISRTVRDLARRAFAAIDGGGMARVDFFLCGEVVYVNEINTIPGFTPTSMFPLLWAASGLTYDRLIDRLIELAIERHG